MKIGIEEEFFLLDRESLKPLDRAEELVRNLGAGGKWHDNLHTEFLASQIEYGSNVNPDCNELLAEIKEFRRELNELVTQQDLLIAGIGTTPDTDLFPTITSSPRYEQLAREMAGMVADHQISGLHVHVNISNRSAGVCVLNLSRPWLPLLTAIGANSPWFRGVDTGFDSWRTVELSRWATGGPPPYFDSADNYSHRSGALLDVTGVFTKAQLKWSIRLSEQYPTVEFRMADSQLRAEDSILIAYLCQALTELGEAGKEALPIQPEMLQAATINAAQMGTRTKVYSPITNSFRKIRLTIDDFLNYLEPALNNLGTTELVTEALARLLQQGNGAGMQRTAFQQGGLVGLRQIYQSSLSG